MKLREYLEKHCLQQNAFCRKHGISVQTLIRAKNNGQILLSTAKKIVEATGGEVAYDDLLYIKD